MAYCAYCGSWTEQVSQSPCASCGKPTNGAPVRAVSSSGANPAVIVVVVIVVVLSGVAILGILAAIAIPNFLTAKQRAEQKRTMADIRAMAIAVEVYATQHNMYPKADSVDGLLFVVVPKYAKTLRRTDGWGNDLRYRCTDNECTGYAISSAGADRIFEHVDASEYKQRSTSNFDCDIVFSNGSFVQYPEGRSN